jgi:hypothetical protein
MVKRHSTVRKRGLTGYKVAELLNGEIRYPNLGYTGYGDPLADHHRDTPTANYISDEMRQDWEANREELMALWRSGKIAVDMSEYGLPIMMQPWLMVCGSRNTLPWAALEFDRDRLPRPTQPTRKRAEGKDRRL